MGLSDPEIACQELAEGWRIRAQGGLIVHIRKDGQLTVSGKNTHAVRRALGLTSRRLTPAKGPGVTLRKKES